MRHTPTILALVIALGGMLAACGGGDPGTETASTDREPPAATAAGEEGVLHVKVECCGAEGVEQAVGIAHGVQAARDLPDSAPVWVEGADARLVALAADRMVAAGHTLVWMVVQ